MADFAPYQDTSPDVVRALSPSPPPSNSRRPLSRSPPPSNIQRNIASALPPPSHFANNNGGLSDTASDMETDAADAQYYGNNSYNAPVAGNSGFASGRAHVNLFETSLPMRLDYEAVAAYVLLPPAGAVFLLLVEHKSDFVRFHAWQSALLFTGLFVIHLIFSFSSVMSWILFTIDILLVGLLSYKAYQDADNLDRFEIPVIGPIASNWVDAE